MTRSEKNKIFKIYRTINALAIGGKGNFMEYKNLVDEIVSKGDYNYFKMTLLIRYRIEVSNYRSINEMKNSTWESICFQTLTPTQQKLKVLYKQKNIYQNGYDVYSDNPKYLTFTYSGPLSSTYSQLATQSQISFTYSTGVFIELDNPNTYNVEFKRIDWQINNGVRTPIDLFDYYSISSGTYSYLTQSLYNTTIPIDHGSDYLITTYARDPYLEQIYSFNLSKDNYIGKIEEIDVLTDRASDYYEYMTMTYSGPLSSTYSQLATQSHISFDFKNALVQMKFTNNPLSGATGATGPYLHNIRFQMVKYVDGEPVNLEYYTEIDSGTYSYFMGGSYKIPLSINPFIEFGTNFIVTTKSRNVGSNASIKQYYKMSFGLGRIAQLQEDISIYYRNSQLAQKLGKKRTFLKATKKGQTDGTLFMSIDFNVSEEMNLYYRYRNAVEYLLS